MRSRWRGSMLAWILNTKPENVGAVRRQERALRARAASAGAGAVRVRPRAGGGAAWSDRRAAAEYFRKPSSRSCTPKLFAALPKNTGESSPAQHGGGIEGRAGHVEHLDLLARLGEGGVVEAFADHGRVEVADLQRRAVSSADGALEQVDLLAETVVHAAKFRRPVPSG